MKIKFKGDKPAPQKITFRPSKRRIPPGFFDELGDTVCRYPLKMGDKILVAGLDTSEVYVISGVSCEKPRIDWARARREDEAKERRAAQPINYAFQVSGTFECTLTDEDYRRLERKALEAKQAEEASSHWVGAILHAGNHIFETSENIKKLAGVFNSLGGKKRTRRGD